MSKKGHHCEIYSVLLPVCTVATAVEEKCKCYVRDFWCDSNPSFPIFLFNYMIKLLTSQIEHYCFLLCTVIVTRKATTSGWKSGIIVSHLNKSSSELKKITIQIDWDRYRSHLCLQVQKYISFSSSLPFPLPLITHFTWWIQSTTPWILKEDQIYWMKYSDISYRNMSHLGARYPAQVNYSIFHTVWENVSIRCTLETVNVSLLLGPIKFLLKTTPLKKTPHT
jgi:hypothetical protein